MKNHIVFLFKLMSKTSKTAASIAWIALLKLCDITGLVTSAIVYHTLSPYAFKRYGRWITTAFKAIDRFLHYISIRLADLTYLKGRVGTVIFNVDDEERDGYLMLREYGDQRMVRMNFRIENRWVAERGKLTNRHLNELMTQALDAGYRVAHVYWGERRVIPYNVEAISLLRRPDDVRLPPERRWYVEPKRTASSMRPELMNIIQRA